MWKEDKLHLVVVCQYQFIHCDKYRVLISDANRGIEQRIYANSLYDPWPLLCKSKAVLKSRGWVKNKNVINNK